MTNRDRAWELIPSSLPQTIRSEIVDAVERALDEAEKRGRLKMRERAALHAQNPAVIRALPVEE